MPIVIVVGGLGESNLRQTDALRSSVWIDPTTLLLGQVGKMRLAPDGTSPGPPDGVALVATGGIGPYLTFPAIQLGAQMVLDGWDYFVFPWDWRKNVYPAGVALAGVIRGMISPGDPCAIVGHSAGGLVARAAWTELGLTGEQNLVQRIVTLGTPHWGSYSVVGFFQGSNETIDLLTYWNGTVGYNTAGYAPDLFGYQRLDTLFYQKLGATWPGLYDVFPVLGAPDAPADPNRELLYDATNWPAEIGVQQTWLDYAKNVTGPWLRSAASMPPSNILTCLGGYQSSAASAVVDPAAFRRGAGLGQYSPADNTVTLVSSLLSTGTNYQYQCNHEDWLPSMVARGILREELLAVNPSPAPAPPPPDPLPVQPMVGPIPAAELPNFTAPIGRRCTGGACFC